METEQVDCVGLLDHLSESLELHGLDLVRPFSVRRVNKELSAEQKLPLLGFPDALGILVGNSRALWSPFLGAFESGELPLLDPLDHYIERSVAHATHLAARELSPMAAQVLTEAWAGFSHRTQPRPLPMQKLAHLSGLALLGPAQLNIHPSFGPWIALRAVLVLPVDPANSLSNVPPPMPSRCSACSAPCRDELARALDASDASTTRVKSTLEVLTEQQRRFLRVREVCPLGSEARYSDSQIIYHYGSARRPSRR